MSEPLRRPSESATADQARLRRIEAVYGVLWLAGTIVPVSRFLPWLAEHGLDLPRFRDDMFANAISAFFAWDVIVAVVTLLVLAAADRALPTGQRLAVAAASVLIGASSGLPLYLLLRERQQRGAVD
jgi:hypothetical protein